MTVIWNCICAEKYSLFYATEKTHSIYIISSFIHFNNIIIHLLITPIVKQNPTFLTSFAIIFEWPKYWYALPLKCIILIHLLCLGEKSHYCYFPSIIAIHDLKGPFV